MSESDPRKRLLTNAEVQWDIRSEVVKEWGPTFDKLLSLHNTQDLKTIINSQMPGRTVQPHTDNTLPISELKDWMKPKFEPSIWKKCLWPDQYTKEKELGTKVFSELFGKPSNKRGSFFDDEYFTRTRFIDGIMEEIRYGDKEV